MATVEQPRIGARSGARMSQRTFSAWVALAAFLLLTLEEFLWGTAPIDGALTNILEHPDTRLLDRIGSLLSALAGVQVTVVLAVFAVVLLYRRGARRSVLAVAAAFALALAVEGVLKLLLHHPDVPNPLSPPSAPLPPNSFPSGHVLRASVLATAATFLWPRQSVRVAALVIVALVAYTRIYTGAHWTSDVLAALLLGWALHVGSAAYAHVADQSQRPTCAPV